MWDCQLAGSLGLGDLMLGFHRTGVVRSCGSGHPLGGGACLHSNPALACVPSVQLWSPVCVWEGGGKEGGREGGRREGGGREGGREER